LPITAGAASAPLQPDAPVRALLGHVLLRVARDKCAGYNPAFPGKAAWAESFQPIFFA
jgi:hypothetical protein